MVYLIAEYDQIVIGKLYIEKNLNSFIMYYTIYYEIQLIFISPVKSESYWKDRHFKVALFDHT